MADEGEALVTTGDVEPAIVDIRNELVSPELLT